MKAILSILFTAFLFMFPALLMASGGHDDCHHDCDENTYNTTVHKRSDLGKGVAIGVLLTCGVMSAYTKAKEDRWTWCGERDKPEPIPVPGPAVKNDVTPDNLKDNRYIIEAR